MLPTEMLILQNTLFVNIPLFQERILYYSKHVFIYISNVCPQSIVSFTYFTFIIFNLQNRSHQKTLDDY